MEGLGMGIIRAILTQKLVVKYIALMYIAP